MDVAHEVGHVLLVNGSHLHGKEPQQCDTVFTGEGCLSDASRLLADLDETWSDKGLDERSDINDITDDRMANYDDGDPGDGAGKTDWFEHRRNLVSAEHLDGWTKLRALAAG